MIRCPSCGFDNDPATRACAQCGRPLPSGEERTSAPATTARAGNYPSLPPMPPGMAPPAYPSPPAPAEPLPFPGSELTGGQKAGQYFLGIGLAILPGALAFLLGTLFSMLGAATSAMANILPWATLLLFGGAFVFMIYSLTQARLRFIGYGMLTMLVVAPVVLVVACLVILSGARF